MKKNVVMLLSILMPMLATTGCQNEYDAYQSKIEKMLSDTKVKNIESYSQLGYVSKTSSDGKRNGRKNAYKVEKWSTTKFYLAGMIGEEVVGLDLSNGNSFWDLPLSSYCDLGDFIGFSPESFHYAEEHRFDWARGFGDCECSIDYLLSKKTGKLYKCNSEQMGLTSFKYGEKILYAHYTGENDAYWATITEENEQLVIKKSGMLDFIYSDLMNNPAELYFDRYGNILKSGLDSIATIYGHDQKTLTPNIEIDMPYGYDKFTNTIYTYHDGSFYVLEGLEFKKYDNVIFGYSFVGGDSPNHYFYYIDDQGNYKVGYDEGSDFNYLIIYQEDVSSDGSVRYSDKFDYSQYNYYFFNSHSESWKATLNIYGNYYFFEEDCALFEKLGTYTYLPLRWTPSGIRRDQYVYFLENYKFIKYDIIEGTYVEIETKGYQITSVSEDEYGNIVLTGYDSSFNEFTGYLNENDEVVFEPTNKGNAEYDVIYMNPIN